MDGPALDSKPTEPTFDPLSLHRLSLRTGLPETAPLHAQAHAQFITPYLDGVLLKGVIRVVIDTIAPTEIVQATITLYMIPDIDIAADIKRHYELIGREELRFHHLTTEEQNRVIESIMISKESGDYDEVIDRKRRAQADATASSENSEFPSSKEEG